MARIRLTLGNSVLVAARGKSSVPVTMGKAVRLVRPLGPKKVLAIT